MRMRAPGDIRFGLTYDENDEVRGMNLLEKQLLKLSKHNSTVKDEERGDQDSVETEYVLLYSAASFSSLYSSLPYPLNIPSMPR